MADDNRAKLREARGLVREADPSQTSYCVFDIETTGLAAGATVTLIAYVGPGGTLTVHCTDPAGVDSPRRREEQLSDQFQSATEQRVEVTVYENERNLLQGFHQATIEFPDETVFAAYNGLTYRGGGFDVPHLRSRALANGLQGPLQDRLYLDIKDALVSNAGLNTNSPSVPSQGSLSRTDWDSLAAAIGHDDPSQEARKGDVREWVADQAPSDDELLAWANEHDKNILDTDGTLDGMFADLLKLVCEDITRPDVSVADDPEGATDMLWSEETIVPIPDVSFDPDVDGEAVAEAGKRGDLEPVGLHCIADVLKTRFLLDVLFEYGTERNFRVTLL